MDVENSLLFSTLVSLTYFETGSLSKPGACCFGCLAGQGAHSTCPFLFPSLGLQMSTATAGSYVGVKIQTRLEQ